MANIILNKIPIDSKGDYLISCELLSKIHTNIYNRLKEKYPEEDYVLFTIPTELSVVSGDTKIIRINANEYSADEIISAIKESQTK